MKPLPLQSPFFTAPRALAIGVALFLISSTVPVAAQSTWLPRVSNTDDPLTGVGFGGGLFVAVGEPGVILTSPDGIEWTERNSGTTQPLRGVTYGNGLFLVTGAAGTALTSPDGITWTPRNTSTSNMLSGAAFGDGRFVAVGGSGTIRFSDDGVTWQLAASTTSAFLQGVTYGGGKFVAVGFGKILHSTDGQTWTSASSGVNSVGFYLSPSYLNGVYVVVGLQGLIARSTDAENWVTLPVVVLTTFRGITNNGSQFVAVGDPLPEDGQEGQILTSPDGLTWDAMDLEVDVELFGIAHGATIEPNRYVVVGPVSSSTMEGLILSSCDDQASGLTFEAWRQLVFDAGELADPLISGAGADPDCDGIPNFSEYALGLPPKQPDGHDALAQISKELPAANPTTVTFKRPADRLFAVSYSISCSTDLATWTDLELEEEIVSETDGIQTVRFVDPGGSPGDKFYRIEFSGG